MIDSQTLHTTNQFIAIIVALFLNAILVYFVIAEKAKFLQIYRNMILLNCLSEVLFISIIIVVRPQEVLVDDVFIIVVEGSIQGVSQEIVNLMSSIFIWATSFDTMKLAIDFLFRYLIVCSDVQLSTKKLCLMHLGIYLWSSTHGLQYFLSLPNDPQPKWEIILREKLNWPVGEAMQFSITDSASLGCKVLLISGWIAALIIYVIIIGCEWKIIREFRRQIPTMSPKTQQMHKALNRMLFAQAGIPVIISTLPSFVTIMSMSLGYGLGPISVLTSMIFCWTPSIGPSCSLYFIPSYRNHLIGFMSGKFKYERKSSNSIQNISVINTQIA